MLTHRTVLSGNTARWAWASLRPWASSRTGPRPVAALVRPKLVLTLLHRGSCRASTWRQRAEAWVGSGRQGPWARSGDPVATPWLCPRGGRCTDHLRRVTRKLLEKQPLARTHTSLLRDLPPSLKRRPEDFCISVHVQSSKPLLQNAKFCSRGLC